MNFDSDEDEGGMMSPPDPHLRCFTCKKVATSASNLSRCSRCKNVSYCNAECQRADWPKHKTVCRTDAKWSDKYRGPLRDGSYHFGDLELITWSWKDDDGDEMGWGHVVPEEAEEHKAKLEKEYGGNEERFYLYWPQAFRWTCCGMDGGMRWGCDHHGRGPKPCTCDFCKMGKPLPNKIFNSKEGSRKGLNLARGPDPRSYNRAQAAIAEMGRSLVGMDG